MRILFFTQVFWPSIGGIEIVTQFLAEEAVAAGHAVVVATSQPGSGDDATFPFEIVRQPSLGQLIARMRRADLVVLGGMSLKAFLPAWLMGCRTVVTHHFRYIDARVPGGPQAHLKLWLARRATMNTSCSRYVAAQFGAARNSVAIPNCVDDGVFRVDPGVERDGDLLYVGRLVSDKGVDVLLDALGLLASEHGARPRLTIVGSGEEEAALGAQADRLGIAPQLDFLGRLTRDQVAAQMRRHRVIVVPSRWNEPFGMVAMEGIASGCLVVGSSGGGLPEAIGPCGFTFPNEDARACGDAVAKALAAGSLEDFAGPLAMAHLDAHRRAVVAARFMEVFTVAAGRHGT